MIGQRYEIQAKGEQGPYRWMPIIRSKETPGALAVATIYQKLGDPLSPHEVNTLINMCNSLGSYFYRVQKGTTGQ